MFNMQNRATPSRAIKMLTALGAVMTFAGVANAQATDAGRTVSNTFTLDYSVNNTPQITIDNTGGTPGDADGPTVFTVDRLIDLTLVQTNSPQSVAPGTLTQVDGSGALTLDPDEQPAVLTYTVTNTGNDNQAYSFSTASPAGTFAATDIRIFYEDGNNNLIELTAVTPGSGNTTQVTQDIPAGETRNVFILANIPANAENNQFDDIILTAEARDPVNWAFEGVFTTTITNGVVSTTPVASPAANATAGNTTLNNVADANNLVGNAQNVFADGAGDTDAAADGLFSDTAQFLIAAPNLTGVKSVRVIATDGSAITCGDFNVAPIATPNQFSTAGACVEYTITVTNNGADDTAGNPLPAAQTLATGIDVVDVLPPELIFQSAQAAGFTVAPVADTPPAAGTVCDGTIATCRVAFVDAELAANPAVPGTVIIRALIQ